jgi:hypothetical protein
MTSAKHNFAVKAQEVATTLIQAIDEGIDLDGVWSDRMYGSGRAIVDADVSDLNITAAELTSLITAFQQLKSFVDNVAVTQGDYRASFNSVRRDM